MASPTRESTGQGTCGLHGSESAYRITAAALALEVLLSISSSLWVALLFPGMVSVVSVSDIEQVPKAKKPFILR